MRGESAGADYFSPLCWTHLHQRFAGRLPVCVSHDLVNRRGSTDGHCLGVPILKMGVQLKLVIAGLVVSEHRFQLGTIDGALGEHSGLLRWWQCLKGQMVWRWRDLACWYHRCSWRVVALPGAGRLVALALWMGDVAYISRGLATAHLVMCCAPAGFARIITSGSVLSRDTRLRCPEVRRRTWWLKVSQSSSDPWMPTQLDLSGALLRRRTFTVAVGDSPRAVGAR